CAADREQLLRANHAAISTASRVSSEGSQPTIDNADATKLQANPSWCCRAQSLSQCHRCLTAVRRPRLAAEQIRTNEREALWHSILDECFSLRIGRGWHGLRK
ncbi:hypothetical protein PC113_g23650, partial [Phytophthora cactorum]